MSKLRSFLIAATTVFPVAAFAEIGVEKFDALDTNRDSAISKAEANAYYDMMFGAKDANGDGKITRAEFDAYHNGKPAKQAKRHFWEKKHADR